MPVSQSPEKEVLAPAEEAPASSLPRVTVVVLNWCKEEITRECLDSIHASEACSLTTLLVDNGSPDGSGERLHAARPDIHYLQTGSNLGYTGGNNLGIQWALDRGADYVLIINNDAVLQPGAVEHLLRTASEDEERVAGVVPKILYHDEPDRIWYGGGEFSPVRGLGLHWREGEEDRNGEREAPRDVTFMTGCCMLLSTAALEAVGTFDTEFFAYLEDVDLSIRLRRAGMRMVYQPRARVLHHSLKPGERPSPFQIRQRDRNRRRVMAKHFSFVGRIPFLLRFYATRAVLFLVYFFDGDRERARAILEGMRTG